MRVNYMGCKGYTKTFEGGDLCKLDPCYNEYNLAIKQDDFEFYQYWF